MPWRSESMPTMPARRPAVPGHSQRFVHVHVGPDQEIEFQNELSFVKLASYDGTCSTGCVKSLIGLNNPIEGRHVIIVEDIVDTGESIEHMIKELEARNPASVEVCTLFFKPGSYRKTLPIKYRAMEIGNEFIVGYGLDYDQLGRSLKDIYVVTE